MLKYKRKASTATSDGSRFSRFAARSTRRPTANGNSIVYCRLLISFTAYHSKLECQGEARE
jgi:hypothetical protein